MCFYTTLEQVDANLLFNILVKKDIFHQTIKVLENGYNFKKKINLSHIPLDHKEP